MKHHLISPFWLAALTGISLITPTLGVIDIDYVPVGNAGNVFDSTGYGAVAYTYKIGKYEVSNAQYAAFLNAADPTGLNANGIYNTLMGSDIRGGITLTSGAANGSKYSIRLNMGDKPVNFVSWYDAARFANWLHNGQGSGSTETGAYTLSGNTGFMTKNVGAIIWLPSENEWYKAAYYDPTPGASGNNYWVYPTRSDTQPSRATANSTGSISNPGANVANAPSGISSSGSWNGQTGNVTTIGSAQANNFYGTFDQGGNVWEWNDAVIDAVSPRRGLRGGSFGYDVSFLTATARGNVGNVPTLERNDVGFRVATLAIPDIALEAPTGTLVTNGNGTLPYGSIVPGQTSDRFVTIRNAGTGAALTAISASITGPDAGQFSLITSPPATLASGASAQFTVRFLPASLGAKTATLSIVSNDPDENPFTLALGGTGNTLPTFSGYAVSTPYETTAPISLGKLLSTASDADGDALSVTATGPASTQGGTAQLQASSILYTPPNGFSGSDTFQVTVTDSRGGSVTGTVTVAVQSDTGIGTNPPVLTMLSGGRMGIDFYGIPGRSYEVQRSTNLTTWTLLSTITAATDGTVNYIDDSPPPGSAFYRLRKP